MIVEKYSASGNDFLILAQGWREDLIWGIPKKSDLLVEGGKRSENLDLKSKNKIFREKRVGDGKELAKMLCHRFEGIGADGLVILSPHSHYPYQWDFYNSDGSKALMCGNASRCVGLYAFLHDLAERKHCFLSGAGEIGIEILSKTYPYIVRSLLGEYQFLGEQEGWMKFDTGVPHLVKLGSKSEFEALSVEEMKILRKKHNANVNIAYQENDFYRIKTYERGVESITQACGTGMAALMAHLQENHNNPLSSQEQKTIAVIPPSGERLEFELEGRRIAFSGEVKKIAQCQIDLREFGVKYE